MKVFTPLHGTTIATGNLSRVITQFLDAVDLLLPSLGSHNWLHQASPQNAEPKQAATQ